MLAGFEGFFDHFGLDNNWETGEGGGFISTGSIHGSGRYMFYAMITARISDRASSASRPSSESPE